MQQTKTKKTKRWKKVLIILAVIVLAVLLLSRFLPMMMVRNMADESQSADIRSATAETGSISTTVSGTGSLTAADAEDVTLPEGVEVETVYVTAGDFVSAGDTLATVDLDSVYAAMEEVQEAINDLDDEIEDKEDDTPASSIKAGVAGRVKIIYAEEDESVSQIMADHGALMVLSMDGKMAVELANSDQVAVGDEVVVTLSDGDTEEGSVASKNDDIMVITLTDNGPDYGETVTVTTEDGTDLGSGQLVISSPLAVTGYTGSVSSIKVDENDKVSASKVLIKLTDLGHTSEYTALLSERQELTDELQTLIALAQNGIVTAPFDGTIQTVELEGETSVSDASSQGGYYPMSFSTPGTGSVTLLSAVVEDTTQEETSEGGTSEEGTTEEDSQPSEGTQDDAQTEEEEQQPSDVEQTASVEVKLTSQIALENGAITDYAEKFILCLSGEGMTQQKANDQTGLVTFDALTFTKPGSYVYRIYQTKGTDSQITYDTSLYTLTVNVAQAEDGSLTASVTPDVTTVVFTNQFAQTQENDTSADSQLPSGSTGSMSGMSGGSSWSGSFSGSGSGAVQTTASTSASDSTTSSSTETERESTVLLTMSPNDTMTVTVTIDELDILSLEKGQTAEVTVDAIGTEPIEGTVTGIDYTGSSSGGVTRYTAEVTVEKTEQMLSNMSASVEIYISQAENCLVIPEEALQQSGRSTFVYTTYDEETGELGGETEVTTGVSDGTRAEITSGLAEGDTVYYEYSDAGSESGFSMMGGFGGMSAGGFSGEMPSGGDMPSGDFGGGRSGGDMPGRQ